MFRYRDASSYDGMLSTGDTAPLAQIPFQQLQQILCCSLAYIQRGEIMAARFMAVSAALRGQPASRAPAVDLFTDNAKIRDRYDPASFFGYVDDGSRVRVSEMSHAQLVSCNVRAFNVCERVIPQDDGFYWWGQRPAVTVGSRLKAFMARSQSLPTLDVISENRVYSQVRRLDSSTLAQLVEEMGVYEDVPEFSATDLAFKNIPYRVHGVSLKPAIADFLSRFERKAAL